MSRRMENNDKKFYISIYLLAVEKKSGKYFSGDLAIDHHVRLFACHAWEIKFILMAVCISLYILLRIVYWKILRILRYVFKSGMLFNWL